MKTGKTLQELAVELRRQAEAKRDFVLNTAELTALTARDEETGKGKGTELYIPGQGEFPVNDHAHMQIATRLKIPKAYYDRLRRDQPALLDENVNALFRREPENRMVRTLDGNARAFLSSKFNPGLDNWDIAQAILPVLGKLPEVQFQSCEVTETRLYIKAVVPGINGHLGDMVQPGHHVFLDKESPDYCQMGIVITNSEVGAGSFRIEEMLFRLACLNGMIVNTTLKKYHVSKNIDVSESRELFRTETVKADDAAFMMKVQDVVNAAVDQTRFDALIQQFRDNKDKSGVDVAKPVEGVQELAKKHDLTEREGNDVLKYLMAGNDLSMFGVVNAVTRAAQDCESYDRSTELERLGGSLMLAGCI